MHCVFVFVNAENYIKRMNTILIKMLDADRR